MGFSVSPESVAIGPIHLKFIFSALCELVKFNLSDIGEGIREVQIKEW